jgi:hypothetical protein
MMDGAIQALVRKYPGLTVTNEPGMDAFRFTVVTPSGNREEWMINKDMIIQLPTPVLFSQIISWLHKVGYLDAHGNIIKRTGVVFPPQFYNSPPPMPRTNFEGEWDVEVVKPQKKKPVRMGKWGVKLN